MPEASVSDSHPLSRTAAAGLRSFWMAGFEAGTQINRFGKRIDMIAGTRHDYFAHADYELIRDFGFSVARDALRWHLIDRGGGSLDFSSFLPMLKAAQAAGIQVIWSLHHYGSPDGLDLFSPDFVNRFERYARATARMVREHSSDVPYYTPINEISFFSWAAARHFMHPYALGQDALLKRQLVRATVQACRALRDVDPRCRFLFCDPIIHVAGNPDVAGSQLEAQALDDGQFEAWDMIAGRIAPELGGSEDLLDIVGVNFYASNQWIHQGTRLIWDQTPTDPRWRPLSRLLERVWRRYQRPLLISETSHVGIGRPAWILDVARETALAHSAGIPVEGICLFPILDRYDWDDTGHWHNSGLWDLNWQDGSWNRTLNLAYAEAVRSARQIVTAQGTWSGMPIAQVPLPVWSRETSRK